MTYAELRTAALPDLAAIATDARAAIAARLSASESLAARVSETTGAQWTLFTDAERAALRAAYCLTETLAARGFTTDDIIGRYVNGPRHGETITRKEI